jgi:transcriptional regulator with XRE-family HTH domain
MTDTLGARLRHVRERQHVALKDIAAATKIQASLFEGLERDDVSRWPCGIFRRAFIRAYANAIGLDPDSVCREFLACHPDPHEAPAAPVSRPAARVPTETVASSAGLALHGPTDGALRLTLADAGLPFTAGRLLRRVSGRWRAVAWDGGTLLVVALSLFVALDAFWEPLGIATLAYYFGSILLLGNTPGVCLFARKTADTTGGKVVIPAEVDDDGGTTSGARSDDSCPTRPSLPLSLRPRFSPPSSSSQTMGSSAPI